MRPTRYMPSSETVLSALTSVALFGAIGFAQDNNNNNNNDNNNSNNDNKDAKSSDNNNNNNADNKASTENKNDNKDQKTQDNKDQKTQDNKAATTQEKKAEATADKDVPTLGKEKATTTAAQAEVTRATSAIVAVTGRPTLTGVKPIPEYPAPTVPPTNNAPFMQHSSAPEGTVFIAVGAILGALGIAILLWRLIVGILLHRSVEKAAQAQHDTNAKSSFPAPPAPFYKYTDNASTMSLSAAAAAGRGVRRTNRGPAISSVPSQSNLFFSPTAAASGNAPSNRGSTFLPSGFYAAGNTSPGGANHEHSISLTNLRPDSRGLNSSRQTLSHTPPDSPGFNPRRDISSTSLNLNRPPSQRAPSAFLDDLLADDPSSLPPPHMPASGNNVRNSYGSNSPGPQNRF